MALTVCLSFPEMPDAQEIIDEDIPTKLSVTMLLDLFAENSKPFTFLVFGRFVEIIQDKEVHLLDVCIKRDQELIFRQLYCTTALNDKFFTGTFRPRWTVIEKVECTKKTSKKRTKDEQTKFYYNVTCKDLTVEDISIWMPHCQAFITDPTVSSCSVIDCSSYREFLHK